MKEVGGMENNQIGALERSIKECPQIIGEGPEIMKKMSGEVAQDREELVDMRNGVFSPCLIFFFNITF